MNLIVSCNFLEFSIEFSCCLTLIEDGEKVDTNASHSKFQEFVESAEFLRKIKIKKNLTYLFRFLYIII